MGGAQVAAPLRCQTALPGKNQYFSSEHNSGRILGGNLDSRAAISIEIGFWDCMRYRNTDGTLTHASCTDMQISRP